MNSRRAVTAVSFDSQVFIGSPGLRKQRLRVADVAADPLATRLIKDADGGGRPRGGGPAARRRGQREDLGMRPVECPRRRLC